ncbi:MAG: hypothetical protein U5K37_08445 [Natrialbaceae archaeon]|nr:hypothetical protein [Natrialbaceae archaeon]
MSASDTSQAADTGSTGGSNVERIPDIDDGIKGWATGGVLLFGVLAVGTLITTFFVAAMGDDSVLQFGRTSLSPFEVGLFSAYREIATFGPLVTIVLAWFYHQQDTVSESTAKPAVVSALSGYLTMSVILLILLILIDPLGLGMDFGEELPGIIGILIGLGGTAAVAGVGFDRLLK